MARNIGTPSTQTVQRRRELFRTEIEVQGTDAAPVINVRGHAQYVARDANGAEVGRQGGYVTVVLSDAEITGSLRAGLIGLLNRLDTVALPGES